MNKTKYLLLAVALALLLAVGLVWRGGNFPTGMSQPRQSPELLALNNKGVGEMERFDYEAAVSTFEKVVAMDPNWLPGQVNLGIALLNEGGTSSPEMLERTRKIFEDVLKKDPNNPHAHHCLGVLLLYQKDAAEAIEHFEAVTKIDPNDAGPWFFLGLLVDDGPKRREYFERALACDPYHIGALYQIGLDRMRTDPKKGKEMLAAYEALKARDWGNPTAIKYSEMGKYGEAIGSRSTQPMGVGPLPELKLREANVQLRPGARWTKDTEEGGDAIEKLRQSLRRQRGSAMVVFDLDGDNRLDVFLAGAVVEAGKTRDLLLRNTGDGFLDVTREAMDDSPFTTLGATVADLDNDGRPDLILAGFPGVKLYRNIGGGKLEDITRQGGLEAAKGVYTAAAVVDLDQDSDLDILLAEYQATPEGGDGGLRVWLHVGEAVPLGIGQKPGPPLQCRYRPAEEKSGLSFTGKLLNLVLSDVDGDRDVDLVLLPDGQAPRLLVNDRLLRFRSLPMSLPAERWLGGLSLDGTHSGRSDLLLLAEGKPPRWLLSKCKPGLQQPEDVVFDAGPITSPALRQAGVVDIDLDGWADVLGLTPEGQVLLLHNEAGRLVQRPDTFATVSLPAGVNAALPVVLNLSAKDPQPELLLASSTGLAIVGVEKSKNHGLLVQLSGRMAIESGGMVVRCNADAIGTQVVAQTQELWTSQENATLSAGPGQSRQPLLLGLGGHTNADVVRLRWPDGTLQAELDLASGLARIPQANRKKTSCPVLFTWDGKQYRFVTDMLGAGALGELLIDGSTRMPRPEESVKIEADQLAPRNGHYELVLAEPMDEITYLDALRLEVVDHPRELSVFPDERFATGGKPPTQKIIAFGPRIFPEKARDHRGQDLHSTLSRWDREMARGFARRAWIGFAEEHFVELDFGAQVAKLPAGPLYLCLAGWTDYPFPESIWAANQAGVPMKPPVLERRDASGKWVPLAEVGFPAGLPRMMLLDVSDLPREPGCVLRLRTNLHIYWDQIFLARPEDASRIRTRTLPPVLARLDACGLHQEYSPDGLLPTVFAHDRFDNAPVVRHLGRMTRHGDVLPLLNETDDAFVIFGPQDRLQVHFDAKQLPALPEGWTRSYVLRAWGYCKDTGPFTATGSTVEPLPYRGMKTYPPTGPEAPKSALGESYRTREIRPEREGPRQR